MEEHNHSDLKERLVRIEERFAQWAKSVERRLTTNQQITFGLISLVGAALVSILIALLTK